MHNHCTQTANTYGYCNKQSLTGSTKDEVHKLSKMVEYIKYANFIFY